MNKKKSFLLGLLTLFATSLLMANLNSPAGAATPRKLKLKTVELKDAQGFGRPLTAFAVIVPHDWKITGGVLWKKPCSAGRFYETILKTTSPSGYYGYQIKPGYKIFWNDYQPAAGDPLARMIVAQNEAMMNKLKTEWRHSNCFTGVVKSTQQLIDKLIVARRPAGTRILSTTVLQKQKEQIQNMLRGGLASSMTGTKTFYDAVRVRVRYNSSRGMIDEDIDLAWIMDVTRLPPVGGSSSTTYSTFIFSPHTVWAPAGRLDKAKPVLNAIKRSFRFNPVWQQKINLFNRRINKQNFDASQRRIKIMNEASDKKHRDFIDYIRGKKRRRAGGSYEGDKAHRDFIDMIREEDRDEKFLRRDRRTVRQKAHEDFIDMIREEETIYVVVD